MCVLGMLVTQRGQPPFIFHLSGIKNKLEICIHLDCAWKQNVGFHTLGTFYFETRNCLSVFLILGNCYQIVVSLEQILGTATVIMY